MTTEDQDDPRDLALDDHAERCDQASLEQQLAEDFAWWLANAPDRMWGR